MRMSILLLTCLGPFTFFYASYFLPYSLICLIYWLRLHQHSGSAAVGVVIHAVVFIKGIVPEDGAAFGILKDVIGTGANDVYVVESTEHVLGIFQEIVLKAFKLR